MVKLLKPSGTMSIQVNTEKTLIVPAEAGSHDDWKRLSQIFHTMFDEINPKTGR